MNLPASNRTLTHITLLLMVALLTPSAHAVIGFQATLDSPDRVVSYYDDILYPFSAALNPKTHPLLSPNLNFSGKLESADFKNKQLRFKTEYRPGYSLIPAAVDAEQFLSYRIAKGNTDKLMESVRRSRFDQKPQAGRSGLNIGVALPKRLDRIFGEGGGNLKVTGYRRISFSGRSQWSDAASTDLYRQSKFPALNMEQAYQFGIEGTIGSKISVRVTEDSQTDIPLANRLIIRYKGDDDDILKAVEAGNTTLDLPNTQFVGYSGQIHGLFGFKAVAKVGRLSLTGIMSQEKGSSERSTISSSGEQNAQYIRDFQNTEARIFDLGGRLGPDSLYPNDRIERLIVYEYVQETDVSRLKARLVVNPLNLEQDSSAMEPSKVEVKGYKVKEVDQSKYEVRDDSIGNKHYIYFKSTQMYSFGVFMEVRRSAGPDAGKLTRFGDISITDSSAIEKPMVLKMIYSSRAQTDPSHPVYDYMWRNCYNVPVNANIADLDVKVFKGLPNNEGATSSLDYQTANDQSQGNYLRIFGLDQYKGNSNVRTPDNKVDDRREIYNPDWGLLIFPSRYPFNSDTTFSDENGTSTAKLIQKVPSIYHYTSTTEKTQNSHYYIQLSSKARSSLIRLNKVNIIEGSDRVTLNGAPLARGTDYSIDYNFGSITLLTPRANDPNAVVNVDFEYAPFLSLQKKTLLGVRAEYEWSENFKFGGTVLYKSDKAQDRKPRVGQETAEMLVMDFDTRFRITPSFLTKAVDALPLVTTEVPSAINFSAEVAQSRPNPNVDNAAYIDDFESAVEQLSLGMTRTNWTKSSLPKQLVPRNSSESQYARAKLLWHNPLGGVQVDSVYNRDKAPGEGTINSFRMIYRPETSPSWAGIMTYFASRVDPKRAQLFEVRLKGNKGVLHFDFGKITETIDPNYIATEDTSSKGRIDDFEDVGLDGKADEQEYVVINGDTTWQNDTLHDPSGDNWYFQGEGKCPVANCNADTFQALIRDPNSPIFYDWLNGTEGNLKDPAVIGKPDQQKLGQVLSTENRYFSYKIDLSNSPFRIESSKRGDWYTYRIPIRDSSALDKIVRDDSTQSPKWSDIWHVRVWMETPRDKQPETASVEIAAWYFVQSNWADTLLSKPRSLDTARFLAASVSTEDGTFTKPDDVPDVVDKTNNVTEPQRGLALVYNNFRSGDTGMVVKRLLSVEKYTGYRRMKMYVHGDEHVDRSRQPRFFFRLGRDSLNYYEYFTQLRPGWNDSNEVNIDFNELTALKVSSEKSTEKYRVKGAPSINDVIYFAAGITVDSASAPIGVADSGQVWLDELRVTDVRRDRGNAGRVHVDGSFADLITYNASWLKRDPFFRGVSAATRGGGGDNLGSGSTQITYDYSVTLNLDKFLPRSWTPRLPVSYSYFNDVKIPLLRTGSDIILPKTASDSEKSTIETHNFSVNEAFSRKGRNPLFNLLLNRQSASFSYGRSTSRSATNPLMLGENYNINGNFDMAVQKPPVLPIFFWAKPIPILKRISKSKLGLYPTTWQWSGRFNRDLSITTDINRNTVSSLRRTMDLQTNLNYKVFDNLSATYSYQTVRDISDPDLVTLSIRKLRLGIETNYSQNFSSTYDPKLFTFLTTGFQFSSTYTDRYERPTDSRAASLSSSWSVSGTFRHLSFLGGDRSQPGAASATGRGFIDSSAAKVKKTGRPLYDYPLSLLRFLTGWIQPIGYRYSTGYNNSLPGVKDRPNFGYRLGLYRFADVPTVRVSQTVTAGESENYELSSGFGFLGGLSTDVRFRRAITRDLIRQGSRYENVSTGWPDLSIRINRFTKFPFVKDLVNRFITVFAPQTSYTRQTKEQRDLSAGYLTSRSISTDRSPLLSVTFRVFRSLSMSGSYGTGSSNDFSYNQTTGTLQTESRTRQSSVALTARYSFTAPGGLRIPLLGRLKFNSVMSIDVNVRKSTRYGESRAAGERFKKNTDNSDFSVNPVISYSFSQQLKGGLQGTWQDTNDAYNKRKNHVRQLQIWAEFRF